MPARGMAGELRRDLVCRRIHAVSYRCLAPLGKRPHWTLCLAWSDCPSPAGWRSQATTSASRRTVSCCFPAD
jgi:hypothetical protein